MTNNELLHASLLDILFDGRNKDYGAYALRKDYNHRLLLALGSGLSLILLFIFINMLNKSDDSNTDQPQKNKPDVTITEYRVEPNKPEQPKPKPVVQKTVEQVATVKNTTIKIVDDQKLKQTEVPTSEEILESVTGTENKDGKKDDGIIKTESVSTTGGTGPAEPVIIAEPVKPSSAPAFPGGFEALRKFLAKNLQIPADLQIGETKMVKARFIVDEDGSVSTIEIILSGGRDFDKEVIRVCKKCRNGNLQYKMACL